MVDFETLVNEGTFRIEGYSTMSDYKKELKKNGEKLPVEYKSLNADEILLYFTHEGEEVDSEGVIPLSWFEDGYREVLGMEKKKD